MGYTIPTSGTASISTNWRERSVNTADGQYNANSQLPRSRGRSWVPAAANADNFTLRRVSTGSAYSSRSNSSSSSSSSRSPSPRSKCSSSFCSLHSDWRSCPFRDSLSTGARRAKDTDLYKKAGLEFRKWLVVEAVALGASCNKHDLHELKMAELQIYVAKVVSAGKKAPADAISALRSEIEGRELVTELYFSNNSSTGNDSSATQGSDPTHPWWADQLKLLLVDLERGKPLPKRRSLEEINQLESWRR